jgi:hypothetical protein
MAMFALFITMAAPLFVTIGYALSRPALDEPAGVKGPKHPTDYIPPPAF